ncbi:hypothetical protein [Clostridium algidicarnis]|uniref:Uncharacterized protein n=1 Tax=Clostridium algidicarnis TaxID=37659 RepID=A0ABS6C3E2_9CLOT|nr:hypothetical protein [Clostridium algidicarnis]MBB6631730.1 hypothetical protein [Clostridium algidicarnis]MBU3220016.1 hypothetical protein [Clostridium algidicarnis]MCB2287075.1 hypothetical protein [Clostridium algidicarnis]
MKNNLISVDFHSKKVLDSNKKYKKSIFKLMFFNIKNLFHLNSNKSCPPCQIHEFRKTL